MKLDIHYDGPKTHKHHILHYMKNDKDFIDFARNDNQVRTGQLKSTLEGAVANLKYFQIGIKIRVFGNRDK